MSSNALLADPKPSRVEALVESGPQIALLTPYTGGNLGDAAIQDSMIENLRQRLPGATFSGISLNNENYLQRHGSRVFPLCISSSAFYGMTSSTASESGAQSSVAQSERRRLSLMSILRHVPGAKKIKRRLAPLRKELHHWLSGYRFLREHDMLVVCGGGQLDEEWGGAWGHPFALFKWAVLSRFARVPCAMASVGACKLDSRLSRLFVYCALRASSYRSYRDGGSKEIALRLWHRASADAVVPDLAFGLTKTQTAPPPERHAAASAMTTIAISPIVYAKAKVWPSGSPRVYERYLDQMAELIGRLLKQDSFLVFVWSAKSDQSCFTEIVKRLDQDSRERMSRQASFPQLESWKDLLRVLQSVDYLIASRLHSTILGFLAQIPVVAISFDTKVDRVMRDLKQTRSLLSIHDFTASTVLRALNELRDLKESVVKQIGNYLQEAHRECSKQFDHLAQLAVVHEEIR